MKTNTKVFFVSLGCDKNKADSYKILKKYIDKYKIILCDDVKDSDIAIINTCAFINDAKKESEKYIHEFLTLKKKNIIKKVLVLGCLVKEYEILGKKIEGVDFALSFDKYFEELNNMEDRVYDILSFSSPLKISDGCDKKCSYCIIPKLRGRYKSNTLENVLSESRKLAKNGVKEISLVGQDILNYGIDIYHEKKITTLLNELNKIEGIEWIRLLYCYPEEIDDNLIEAIKQNKKVLHYIDMPLQHINNNILKSMNRPTTKEKVIEKINKLRNEIEDIVIRTTFIVGFPNETDDNFDELVNFIREIKFDKVGVFKYSREKLSPSYDFDNQIDEQVKQKRYKYLIDTQKEIVFEKNKQYIGKTFKSIVEGYDTKKNMYVVRPYFNARDIDDKVYIDTTKNLISGTFINVKIEKVLGYDLVGLENE